MASKQSSNVTAQPLVVQRHRILGGDGLVSAAYVDDAARASILPVLGAAEVWDDHSKFTCHIWPVLQELRSHRWCGIERAFHSHSLLSPTEISHRFQVHLGGATHHPHARTLRARHALIGIRVRNDHLVEMLAYEGDNLVKGGSLLALEASHVLDHQRRRGDKGH